MNVSTKKGVAYSQVLRTKAAISEWERCMEEAVEKAMAVSKSAFRSHLPDSSNF